MATYWRGRVIPAIKKVFIWNPKSWGSTEACKAFNESKEEIAMEFEEKKADLRAKVVEIYEASAVEIKTLVKKPTESGVKKSSVAIMFIEELVKIDFPGSKLVSEAAAKHGPGAVSGPVVFIFEKVSTLVPADPAAESASNEVLSEAVEEAEKAEETPAPAEDAHAAEPAPKKEPAKPAEAAPEHAKA